MCGEAKKLYLLYPPLYKNMLIHVNDNQHNKMLKYGETYTQNRFLLLC